MRPNPRSLPYLVTIIAVSGFVGRISHPSTWRKAVPPVHGTRPHPTDRRAVVIDSDTGVDDVWGIIQLVLDPTVDVIAVTTVFGNSDVDSCTGNALELIELCGADVPVHRGASEPFVDGCGPAPHVHGPTGRGGLGPAAPSTRPAPGTAAVRLAELAADRGNDLTIVAMCRLTNIALACMLAPEALRGIGGVLWMGGAIAVSGNTSQVAEANLHGDPEALQIILDRGVPLTILPLDVTMDVRIGDDDLRELLRGDPHPVVRHACAVMPYYLDFYESVLGVREAAMHCGLLAGIALDPTLVTEAHRISVAVELAGGHTRGMLVVDRRAHRRLAGLDHAGPDELPLVVFGVDGERYKEQLFAALTATPP